MRVKQVSLTKKNMRKFVKFMFIVLQNNNSRSNDFYLHNIDDTLKLIHIFHISSLNIQVIFWKEDIKKIWLLFLTGNTSHSMQKQ